MKSIFLSFPGSRGPSSLFAALTLLALLPYSSASAQAPPVPGSFQDLYGSLNTYLTNFNVTLGSGNGSAHPTLMTGALKVADSNGGPQLLSGTTGMQLQLNALKAMGARAIMVQVGFPVLYEPFLTSQGQSYAAFVAYYQGVASAVRQAGLKLIIENDALLANDVSAGWDVAPFYATLNWTQYQLARAQTAAVIAQTMQPDYMVVLEEPDTEADNSGQANVNTPSGATAMLSLILTNVQQTGVSNLKLGAGVGTWLQGYLGFIQDFVTLPVDFIDMHIYPVNDSFLPNALQIASTAAGAGKPVSMTECWLKKERDSEIGVLSADQVRARNPFSFWAPLDAYFIQTMQKLANYTQMVFLDPFDSEMYFAYQTYDASTENLTPGQILAQESSLVSAANRQALYTSTGMSYYHSIVVPADTVPPTAPGGLSGGSGNPTTAFLNWTAATDNVGVAGYYILRNGSIVGTAANLYYQDSGLTESTTYTYWIEAFDLAGNISAPSQRISVTTADVTPPTAPGNVVATASSSKKVTLTWSASTDNVGVGSYLVFCGVSPAALIQVGRTAGTITSYTSYTLTAGTKYYYGVEAADKSGNVSLMSAIVPVTTPMPPVAPASIAATAASATKIGLTWSTAASGGLPVQYYHVLRGGSAASLSQVAIVAQTSYTDTSVNPAATYYYAVQAADTGADLSPMSAIVSAKTPAPPAAPANLVATPASTSRIGLTWSAAVGGGLPIQNYHVYRGTTSSNLSQVAVVPQTSYWDSTVTAAAKYYYAVVAVDTAADKSPMSAAVAATVPSAPAAPAGLLATPVSTTKVSLTWSVPASGGLPIPYYRVFRGATGYNLSELATVAQPAYTDTSGSPATRYYYAVQAADTGGDLSAMSATVSATTLALPSAPTNLVATAPYRVQISLTWTAAQSGMPLASYSIFRGSSPSRLTSLKVAGATQTSTDDGAVSPGTTYYYGIQANDTGGNVSPMSAIVAVTTPQ